MPQEYFNAAVTQRLNDFRENALSDPREEQMESFPEGAIVETLRNNWTMSATGLYRNWLQYLLSRKADSPASVAVTRMTS
jgi:hypothetical protein